MDDQPPTPQPLEYRTPQAKARPFNRLWVGTVVFVILFLFASILIPSTNRTRDVASYVKTASNLRQIGLAILMYAGKNKNAYPDSFATLLMTEDITPEMFVSPMSNDTKATGPTTRAAAGNLMSGGHCSYVYLGSGLNLSTIEADTVVAYEPGSKPTHAVLFGDGHVERCGPNWWKTFNAKLAARSPTTQAVVLPAGAQ